MSETKRLIDALVPLAEKLVEMSDRLCLLSKAIESSDSGRIEKLVLDVTKIEEAADLVFESAATQIMNVEFLNVNPDYLLDIAKHLDQISDLIERAALLFQNLSPFSSEEVGELLGVGAAQVNQIAVEILSCLPALLDNRAEVDRICEIISEREKTVDGVRERFNSFAIQKMGMTEYRIWLKDILGYLDQIADLGRDLTITFRVVAMKLEKQRTLNLKRTL